MSFLHPTERPEPSRTPLADEPLHLIFLIGCTGCGKGAVGREIARRVGAEILSVDSMKVYRRMDIGTAKASAAARREIPHHLIDIIEPSEEFSVATFVELAERAARQIAARGRPVLCVGGTAMYVKALSEGLFEGPSADPNIREKLRDRADREGLEALHVELNRVDPQAAGRIHRNDERRIVRALEVYELTGTPITALQTQWDRDRTHHRCTFIGLRRELEDQNRRTNMRVKALIERGWVEEVRSLLAEPTPLSSTAQRALGYPELIDHIQGRLSLDEAVEKIKIATRRLAKAQRTWFKRNRRARWFEVSADDTPEAVAGRILDGWESICST